MSTENLLKEINFLAHSKGVDAWVRGRLKALHKAGCSLDAPGGPIFCRCETYAEMHGECPYGQSARRIGRPR